MGYEICPIPYGPNDMDHIIPPMGKPSPEGTVVKNSFDDNAHVVH